MSEKEYPIQRKWPLMWFSYFFLLANGIFILLSLPFVILHPENFPIVEGAVLYLLVLLPLTIFFSFLVFLKAMWWTRHLKYSFEDNQISVQVKKHTFNLEYSKIEEVTVW